jgi:hypothetical protein
LGIAIAVVAMGALIAVTHRPDKDALPAPVADRAVLVAADLGPPWQPSTPAPLADLSVCLGRPDPLGAKVHASSAFAAGADNIGSDVYVYGTDVAAHDAVATYASGSGRTCLLNALEAKVGAKQGLIEQLPNITFGDEATAGRFGVSGATRTYFDVYLVRVGRAVSATAFIGANTPVPVDRQFALVRLVAERLSAV